MSAHPNNTLIEYFNPSTPRAEIVEGMPMAEYRAVPAFAPSDLKLADVEQKNRGRRGHPQKMAEAIRARQAKTQEDDSTPAKDDGTLYHLLVFEPHLFTQNYTVVTPEILSGLIESAKARHGVEKFNANLTEAKEWKAERVSLGLSSEFTEQAKAEILAKADARKRGEVKFHPRLTEYTQWKETQEKAGKIVVWPETVQRLKDMADSLWTLPENRKEREYLEATKAHAQDEVSLFLDLRLNLRDEDDAETPVTVRLKARPDSRRGYYSPTGDLINLKTCRSVHREDFQDAVAKYHYYFSEGGYAYLLKHLGQPPDRVGYLAQESHAPYFAKMFWMPYELLNMGANQFYTTLLHVAKSWLSGDWSSAEYNGVLDAKNPNGCGEVLSWPDWMDRRIAACPDGPLERNLF